VLPLKKRKAPGNPRPIADREPPVRGNDYAHVQSHCQGGICTDGAASRGRDGLLILMHAAKGGHRHGPIVSEMVSQLLVTTGACEARANAWRL